MTVERAAGVLCWRNARDGLEVLLVHRPRYDDWSWPKGKVKTGEPLPRTAVREAAEETGLAVVLGLPLGKVRYRLPTGRPKVVTYWAARPVEEPGADARNADPSAPAPVGAMAPEVDGLAWLPVQEARALLTRASDAEPLGILEAYARAGGPATAPVLVVRHGTSRPRDSWARADADRPLVSAGRRQARGLVPLLACWRPQYLVSSPWRRCLDTIGPYAASAGLTIHTKRSLSGDGARRPSARARRQMQRLLDRARPALLCTHRPVLGLVLDVVRAACLPETAARVPMKDPFLAPAEVLVAHVAVTGAHGRVLALERHRPES